MQAGKLKIKSIPRKGRGVVALKTIRKGEVFEVAPFIPVKSEEAKSLTRTRLSHYIYSLSRGARALALGFGSLYNHDAKPNADFKIEERARVVKFRALRTIKAGDEITIDYGYDPMDPSTWDSDLRDYQKHAERSRRS